MNALLTARSRPWRTTRFGLCRGSAVVEMALMLPLLLLVIFGALTGSLALDRYLGILQFVRYAGSMYARGTDFSVESNKDLLLMGAGGMGITATGGTGVIYLSVVVKAMPGTMNADRLVVAERFVVGNSSFASSRIGTPSASIWPDTTRPMPNGLVRDYENEASAIASLPAAFGNIRLNERIYVAEVCGTLTSMGGWTSFFGTDRFYTRAFF
jgi:hypothetical protein